MLIDRNLRDKMAGAIAAYMRGEIKTRQFEDATGEATEDKGAETAGLQVYNVYDDFIDHPVSVTRDGWEYMRRWLTFLKTDCGLKERTPRCWRYPRPLPALFLVALFLSFVISAASGMWVVLVITWFVLGLAWYPIRRLKFRRDMTLVENDDELQELVKVAPFLSAKDWREHEDLLESYQLPEYDPSVHNKPYRKDERLFSETMFARLAVCVLVLPLFLLWALISTESMMDGWIIYIRTNNEKG